MKGSGTSCSFDSKEQADEKRDWLASLYPPDAQSPDELWVMETPLNRLFTDDFSYKKTDYGYGDGLTWPGR